MLYKVYYRRLTWKKSRKSKTELVDSSSPEMAKTVLLKKLTDSFSKLGEIVATKAVPIVLKIENGAMITAEDIPEPLREIILGAYHQGQCSEDAREAAKYIQIDDEEYLKTYLKRFGAWDDEELSDHDENLCRLVWSMAGDIKEHGDFYYGE